MPVPMIYKRIANPYMPQGTADKTNAPSPAYAPGEIGCVFTESGNVYQRVWLDSGATASAPTGAVAANQLAFWKDPVNFIVTNDQRLSVYSGAANGFGNAIAGIFRNAVSTAPGTNDSTGAPKQYMTDVLICGTNIPVVSDGSGGVGQIAVCSLTAATARVTNVAIGTAPPYQSLGVMRGTPANSVANVDVAIGSFD